MDELKDLFQERFHGHEVPVEPGTWSAISSQLAASAAASSSVSELFRERFSGHELDVDAGVWDAISGQLGHGAAVGGGAASGWGAVTGWAAAGIAALVIVGGLVLWVQEDKPVVTEHQPVELKHASVPAEQHGPTVAAVSPAINDDKAPSKERTTPVKTEEHSPVVGDKKDTEPVTTQPAASTTPTDESVDHMNEVQTPAAGAPNPTTPKGKGMDVVNEVVSSMTEGVDREPLKPASVTDPVLQDDPAPIEPPAEYGSDGDVVPFHLYLPNVFTPNHDSYNDTYVPQGEGINSVIIRIYSLTDQELVFRANELLPWDGTNMFTGQQCPEGHYLYAIEAIGADGQAHSEGQTVRLLREFR